MVAIRHRAQSQAREVWSEVKVGQLDETYNPGILALTVSGLQTEAAQLSAGYLGAFIASETDGPVGLPSANALSAGQARNGTALRAQLDSPLIGVKSDLADGMRPGDALHKGRSTLERMVGLTTDTTAREALATAMQDAPEVEGWQRAVKGTCGACLAKIATGAFKTYSPQTPLDIHPSCNCVAEPVIDGVESDKFRRPSGEERIEKMTVLELRDAFGIAVGTALEKGIITVADLLSKSPMETEEDFITAASATELGLVVAASSNGNGTAEHEAKELVTVSGYTRADGTRVGGYSYNREGGGGSPGLADLTADAEYEETTEVAERNAATQERIDRGEADLGALKPGVLVGEDAEGLFSWDRYLSKEDYEEIQTYARGNDPEFDRTVPAVTTIEALIDTYGESRRGGKGWRVTSLNHMPAAARKALKAGKPVTMREPGFLSVGHQRSPSEWVGFQTHSPSDVVELHVKVKTKRPALDVRQNPDTPENAVGEWDYAPGQKIHFTGKHHKEWRAISFDPATYDWRKYQVEVYEVELV